MLSYANTCITSITLQPLTAKVNCIQILQSKCSRVWRQINLCTEMQPSPARVPYNWFRWATYDSVTEAWGKWPEQLAVFSVGARVAKSRGDLPVSNPFAVSPLILEVWRLRLSLVRSTLSSISTQPLNFGKKARLSSIEFCFLLLIIYSLLQQVDRFVLIKVSKLRVSNLELEER